MEKQRLLSERTITKLVSNGVEQIALDEGDLPDEPVRLRALAQSLVPYLGTLVDQRRHLEERLARPGASKPKNLSRASKLQRRLARTIDETAQVSMTLESINLKLAHSSTGS